MRRKESPLAHLNQPASGREDVARNARLGRIVSLDDEGVVMVWVHGEPGPVRARLAVTVSPDQIKRAIELAQPILMLMEDGDANRPIIVGFVEGKVTQQPVPATVVEADVDGKRVRVVAQDEIVLECGNASITLRRNGRVVIRGTYVETHSEGTNRIKGGQVRIN